MAEKELVTADDWAEFCRPFLRRFSNERSRAMAGGLLWAVAIEMAVRNGVPEDDAETLAEQVVLAMLKANHDAVAAWKARR